MTVYLLSRRDRDDGLENIDLFERIEDAQTHASHIAGHPLTWEHSRHGQHELYAGHGKLSAKADQFVDYVIEAFDVLTA